ncbi:hypothetical protein GCM10007157_22960 [Vreelandella hamiltonii]|uniref:Uncharacterized protein n=2 Tax=Vreelandella hamiltonii TaxID=502829 RepID=A0A8H9LWU2_9GAMM|nr:hypothetical protein GCM10007157_22960 [Halomonas hamiltonii]
MSYLLPLWRLYSGLAQGMNSTLSVEEPYKVNLLDTYRDRITLGADFAAGRYIRDDGNTRLVTDDPSEIFTIERAGPKWETGPNGLLREVPANTLGRDWLDGRCVGVSVESVATNVRTFSSDYAGWSAITGNQNFFDESLQDRYGNTGCWVFQRSDAGSGYISRSLTLPANTRYCISFEFKPLVDHGSVRIGLHENQFVNGTTYVTYNISSKQVFLSTQRDDVNFGVIHLSDGWVRIWASDVTTASPSGGFGGGLIWPVGVPSGIPCFLMGDYQIEQGLSPTSIIPSTDSITTRPADKIAKADAQLNQSQGAWLLRYIKPRAQGFAYILGLGNANDEQLVIGNSNQGTTYIDVRNGVTQALLARSYQSAPGALEISGFTYQKTQAGYLFRFYVNGAHVGEFTADRLPNAFASNIGVGQRRANSNTLYANTVIESVNYLPYALGQSEMQELTAL